MPASGFSGDFTTERDLSRTATTFSRTRALYCAYLRGPPDGVTTATAAAPTPTTTTAAAARFLLETQFLKRNLLCRETGTRRAAAAAAVRLFMSRRLGVGRRRRIIRILRSVESRFVSSGEHKKSASGGCSRVHMARQRSKIGRTLMWAVCS